MPKELTKWEPFREVSRLRREMDRLWEDFFGPGPRAIRPKVSRSLRPLQLRPGLGTDGTAQHERPGSPDRRHPILAHGSTQGEFQMRPLPLAAG